MNPKNIYDYVYSKELEKEIWSNCIFVFDTSALLDFYFFSRKTQDDIFEKLFGKLIGQIFIPAEVEFEYLKRRERTLLKPISEKYESIKKEILNKIKDNLSDLNKRADDLYNRTKKLNLHPIISETNTQKLIDFFGNVGEQYVELEKIIVNEINNQETNIRGYISDDYVLSQFKKYISVGNSYSYGEKLKLYEEGELRYRLQIAPGYMDALGSKGKVGPTKFSDLIIWKQVIDLAKTYKKNVVFIINDLKEDWCYVSNNSTNKRIERPKEELIHEIKSEAAVKLWMYDLSHFLFTAKSIIGVDLAEDSISEVQISILQNEKVLDQWHDKRNEFGYSTMSSSINEGFKFIAQSYKAGKSGYLVAISVDIIFQRLTEKGKHHLNIAIFEAINNLPTTELMSWNFMSDESRLDNIIELPTPVRQLKRSGYAIVVSYPTGEQAGVRGGTGLGQWNGTVGNIYEEGEMCFSNDREHWRLSSVKDHDLFFRTFVKVDL